MKMFGCERSTSPTHNYLWHTSPTVSCSSDPCKHLHRDLERSWPENRTLCTRTDPFPVEHDIKDKCITNTTQITATACNTEQASWYMTHMCTVMNAREGKLIPMHADSISWMHRSCLLLLVCFYLEITKTCGSEVISSTARHINLQNFEILCSLCIL